MTLVVCAFPGTGKSHLCANLPKGKKALDSDSSQFSWESTGVRHPDFPANYIEHIKNNLWSVDYIFVSSHQEVRDALNLAKVPYVVVYPHEVCKAEYLKRFKDRGSPESFIQTLSTHWDTWLRTMRDAIYDVQCRKALVLASGEYLSDALPLLDPAEDLQ